MLKSSEFNSAVPKFTNGNYASNPLDPANIEEPSAQDYIRGTEPLDTLPAQWWNWLCNQFTSRFNKLNTYVKNIFDELTGFLSLLNISPDGTESAITTGQLKNAFKEDYPAYINDKLELGTTYVKKTQKVNNHALNGDITISKADVGLGNVANTGDSANASSGGTTKFTTGGAYNLLSSIAPYFSTSTTYAVGALITYQNKLYECTTAHSAGAWNAGHFTARSVQYVISNYILPSFAPAFSTSTSYAVGAFVIYQNKLYRCKATHSAGAWNTSHFELATLNDINTSLGTKADLLDLASAFSASTSYAVGDYVTYNGNLYRCTVAHSGAWNASHFTLVTVGGDLAKKTDVTTFEDATDVTTHFDNAPYTSRVTDYDRASTDSIIGASFAINQMIKNGNFASDTTNWSNLGNTVTISASGGVMTATIGENYGGIRQQTPQYFINHKYLFFATIKASAQRNNSVGFGFSDFNSSFTVRKTFSVGTSYTFCTFVGQLASGSPSNYYFMLYDVRGGDGVTLNIKDVNAIDLTQMFGSAIADRIYAMEQATEGSGVDWIKSFGFFNKAYYATDEGSIQSAKPSAYRIAGYNIVRDFTAVGATSQYQVVLYADANLRPYTRYCIGIKAPAGISLYFNEYIFKRVGSDSNSFQTTGNYQYFIVDTLALNPANYIGGLGWTILKTYSASASTANITDVCISLADSRFDGQYEKYKGEWSYPLADTELRGIPKLDNDNKLYYDGDVYYPNGDVIRKYGVVDLGSLTWNRDTATEGTVTGKFLSSGISANAIPKSINSIMSNGFSVKNAQSAMQDKCYRIDNSKNLVITDTAYTDATAFKTAMNGVYLIYKLATPTKETVAGYTNPHTLIRKGAEEFVDDRTIALPVGHETTYLSLPDWLSASDPFAIGIDSGIYTELAKKVDKTTTVNGHALSGNVTVTKGDVGLGNVENTGDSAIPTENGITKFTTGGAYNLLTSLAPIFNTSTSYAVGDMVTYSGRLYTCTTAHSAGAWNASHFTVNDFNSFYNFTGGIKDANVWTERIFKDRLCKNWTLGTGFTLFNQPIHSICYGNNLWVASTGDKKLIWSEDGKAWTEGAVLQEYIYKIIYANNLWVAVGNNLTAWSNNGKSWTTTAQAGHIEDVLYANNLWVATSLGRFWWSENGKDWVEGSHYSDLGYENSLGYKDGVWVAFEKDIYNSTDGKTWQKLTSDGSITVGCYGNGEWLAINENKVYKSKDGINWDSSTTGAESISRLIYGNGVYIRSDTSSASYSIDGNHWYSLQGNYDGVINTQAVCYNNGLWVASAGSSSVNIVSVSYDGVLWFSLSLHNNNTYAKRGHTVYYANGMWLIGTFDNAIYWSSFENAI